MSSSAEHTLSIGEATACWRRLAECVDALLIAWRQGPPASTLAEFLPAESGPLRRIALVELVKVDMEQRVEWGATFKTLECYAADFPDLLGGDSLPCDLIYEEFHLRERLAEPPSAEDYFKRFPKQAEDLSRLLGGRRPRTTSSLVRANRPPAPPEPGDRLDDFDLLTRLGQGAFATVFLARQRSLERLVALKVSKDSGIEPQTLAQLDHPHIVRVFDQRALPDGGLRLLYMQFVPGGTLREAIDYVMARPPMLRSGATFLAAIDHALACRGESAPGESYLRRRLHRASWPEVVCWLGARLAAALAYAHERAVLHRDVKPANVLLAADGGPKLADFNISFNSKLDGATPAAYFGGSLAYMSPEQLEACDPANPRQPGDLDGRADLYSLGVMLWETLAGKRPFSDDAVSGDWSATLAGMIAARRRGPGAEAIASLPRDCPAGMCEAIARSLGGDRDSRYSSAADFARALELCLMPRAQRLLAGPSQRLLATPRRFPVAALVLGGLIPNLAMSLLNIAYNWLEIVRGLPSAHQHVFYVQLILVNVIAYGWGMATALYLCWPVIVGAYESRKAGDRWRPTQRRLALLRASALRLGDCAAIVTAVDWAFSGFVFPVWIEAQAGSSMPLTAQHYLHFVVSQTICGLIAATLSFFLVTLASLRTCYPRLFCARPPEVIPGSAAAVATLDGQSPVATRATPVATDVVPEGASEDARDAAPDIVKDVIPASELFAARRGAAKPGEPACEGVALKFPSGARSMPAAQPSETPAENDSPEPQDAERLTALAGRVWFYFGLAVAAPFLAVVVVVGLPVDKVVICCFGLVGLAAFGVSFWLALIIRKDLAALAMTFQPAGGALSTSADMSDSFWTDSGR